jgi:hypothetical protein
MFIRYFLELPLPAEQVEAVLLGPAARWLEGLATDAGRRGEGLLAEVQVGPWARTWPLRRRRRRSGSWSWSRRAAPTRRSARSWAWPRRP